jgi:predicted site-specific integrase-resolvase
MVIQEVELTGLFTAEETAQFLGISINNLRQIQFRGNLKWESRKGRKVYYRVIDVEAYKEKRAKRKTS